MYAVRHGAAHAAPAQSQLLLTFGKLVRIKWIPEAHAPKRFFENPGMKILLKVFTLIPKAKYRPLNYQIWHNRVAGGVLCFAQVILFLFSSCIPSHIFHLIWCDFATPQIIFSANLFLRTHHVRHYPTNILVYFCNLHVFISSFFYLYTCACVAGFLFSTVV